MKVNKLIIALFILQSFGCLGQNHCFESLTLNRTDISPLFKVESSSNVLERLDLEMTVTIEKSIVGDALKIEGEGLYLRYYDKGSEGFLLTNFELKSPNHELKINDKFKLRIHQKVTQELKEEIYQLNKKSNCEFVSLSIETNKKNEITKISIAVRVT